jgi:ABC-2 type transport system permease protein
MRKIIVVAAREYKAAVKTKAFMVSLLLMPILWVGSIVIQVAMKDKVDITDKRVAVVDYTGKLFDSLVEASEQRNTTDIYDPLRPERQIKPKFVFEKFDPLSDDPSKTGLILSDRIRKNEPGDVMAFVIIGPHAIEGQADAAEAPINYHSNSPTYDDVQKWISGPLNDKIRSLRLASANLDPSVVASVISSSRVGNLGLLSLDESGQIKKAEETNELANMFLPLGMMMLMLMVIMIGATPLMHSVIEEKTLRIAEVLLGSAKPFELMMGKLLGMVGVSLTVTTVYLIGVYFALRQAHYDQYFPSQVIWWFVMYLVLAVLMYGSIFIAVGAAVSDLKESQNFITPVMLVAFAPMFVWLNVVREPNSSFSTAMSLIPTATPMLMIVRQVVPPGIPSWQPALGAVLVLLTTTAFVFAAGRIFRVGILIQGKGARVSDMLRWLIRG